MLMLKSSYLLFFTQLPQTIFHHQAYLYEYDMYENL